MLKLFICFGLLVLASAGNQGNDNDYHYGSSGPNNGGLNGPNGPRPPTSSSCPEQILKWKSISYYKPSKRLDSKIGSDPYYVAKNNVPTGLAVHDNRMFLAIPRNDVGVIATIVYIDTKDLNGNDRSPAVRAFPNYETNELTPGYKKNTDRLINVYQTRVDNCGRLWAVDTGTLEYGLNENSGRESVYVQSPSVWIFDAKTGNKIRRIDLTDKYITDKEAAYTGFYSITVESDKNNCKKSFAFITCLNKIITYSYEQNKFWDATTTLSHIPVIISISLFKDRAYFNTDGTLGPATYSSDHIEFSVSLTDLKSGQLNFINIRNEGDRGFSSVMTDIDQRNGVMFFTGYEKNSIGCWDTAKDLSTKTIATIYQDDNTLKNAIDIQHDSKGYLWVLASKWGVYLTKGVYLDLSANNFYIWRLKANDAIRTTICNPLKKAL